MMQYNTIAELQNYIVLDNYVKSSIACEPPAGYQTEAALERELIDDLKNQGYEYVPEMRNGHDSWMNIWINPTTAL